MENLLEYLPTHYIAVIFVVIIAMYILNELLKTDVENYLSSRKEKIIRKFCIELSFFAFVLVITFNICYEYYEWVVISLDSQMIITTLNGAMFIIALTKIIKLAKDAIISINGIPLISNSVLSKGRLKSKSKSQSSSNATSKGKIFSYKSLRIFLVSLSFIACWYILICALFMWMFLVAKSVEILNFVGKDSIREILEIGSLQPYLERLVFAFFITYMFFRAIMYKEVNDIKKSFNVKKYVNIFCANDIEHRNVQILNTNEVYMYFIDSDNVQWIIKKELISKMEIINMEKGNYKPSHIVNDIS